MDKKISARAIETKEKRRANKPHFGVDQPLMPMSAYNSPSQTF